jgi:hypothetical protein
MTVSGMTMIRTERHPEQKRDNQTHRHRSPALRTGRFVSVRWSTYLMAQGDVFNLQCRLATKAGKKGTERY